MFPSRFDIFGIIRGLLLYWKVPDKTEDAMYYACNLNPCKWTLGGWRQGRENGTINLLLLTQQKSWAIPELWAEAQPAELWAEVKPVVMWAEAQPVAGEYS